MSGKDHEWIAVTTYRLANTTLEVRPGIMESYYVVDLRDEETALSGPLPLERAKQFALRIQAKRDEALASRGGML